MSLARATRGALALASLATALTLAATAAAGTGLKGIPLSHPVPAPDFTLRDQGGNSVRLASLRGRFVIVTFLYTHCPDDCPLIADQLRQTTKLLGSDASKVAILAVSTDPQHDDRASAQLFTRQHDMAGRWHFLLGSPDQLSPIWRDYYIGVSQGDSTVAPGGGVTHSDPLFLLDKQGNERTLMSLPFKASDVASNLRQLLAEN